MIYVLDEPTTGLHQDDVRKLMAVLDRLLERGASVVVIEHQLDVIQSADQVLELGPEAGDNGGRIDALGPPETVAATAGSHTGRFLAQRLGIAAPPPGGPRAARKTAGKSAGRKGRVLVKKGSEGDE
jgi:excinuclease ABC subunit A